MTRTPPTFATPLRLERLTRNEAQARSVLAQRSHGCELMLGGLPWALTLEPRRLGPAQPPPPGSWRVHAHWASAPFDIELPAGACTQWLQALFPDLDMPALPAGMRGAFLDAALDEVLAALRGMQHGPASIERVDDAPAAPGQLPQRFGFTLEHDGQTVRGMLATDSLGLMLMAGLAAQRPPAQGPLHGEDLPVRLRAVIGSARLRASELASLRQGDAVLLEHAWMTQDSQLWLGNGHWGLWVRREDAQLVVTQPFHHTETLMDTEDDDELSQEDSAVSLDDMPVRLQFDLGERSLTLGEVTSLHVGQVLDLARPLSQAVSIRANGALVGTGELLEIGGRVAVGITSLGRAAPALPTPDAAEPLESLE